MLDQPFHRGSHVTFVSRIARVIMRSDHHDVVETLLEFVLESSEGFPKASFHPDSSDGASGLSTDGESQSRMTKIVPKCIDQQGA